MDCRLKARADEETRKTMNYSLKAPIGLLEMGATKMSSVYQLIV